jgi:hypothetical protein
VEFLAHPVFLISVFALAGVGVTAWRYVRRQRSDREGLPTIPSPEITLPGSTHAPAPEPSRKHTPRETVERALRRGDKALGSIEGSSLPFLDTSPLTHQEERAETDGAKGSRR